MFISFMNWISNFYNKLRYKIWLFENTFSWNKFFQDVLSVFGALWLLLEILSFFQIEEVVKQLKTFWWLFGIIGTLITIYRSLPKLRYSYKVKNSDVSINLVVGNILELEGSIFVPMNNKFDFDNSGLVMGSNSIIQQFINRNYNGDFEELSQIVKEKLENSRFRNESQNPEYDLGTVVPINSGDKIYYIVSTSRLNESGRSKTTHEDLIEGLNSFWEYLLINGLNDDLVLPLIGTGRGRIKIPRRNIIKEIVDSFVNCENINFCNSLTICIYPKDLKTYIFYFDELTNYIRNAAEQKFE